MLFKFLFRYLLVPLLIFSLIGCERVIDSTGAAYVRRPVLTGLLQPDSIISVRLTYSASFEDTISYEPIQNALISFYENEKYLGDANESASGLYKLSIKPKPGNRYRVVASIAGYGFVEAEDVLPNLSSVRCTINKDQADDNPNNNATFSLSWSAKQGDNYWLGAYVREFRSRLGPGCPPNINGGLPAGCSFVNVLETEYNYVVSNSLYPDRFNAYFDSFYGGYLFGNLLKFNPDNLLQSDTIRFDFTVANQYPSIANRRPGEELVYEFMAVGPGYDRFLKTALQAYQNRIRNAEDALNNPFAEVTPVYSNVKNGLGIFGAINRVRISF